MNIQPIKYSTPFLLFALAVVAFTQQGWLAWLPVMYSFVLIPCIELFLPSNPANMAEAEEAMAKADKRYDYILYAIVPAQYACLVFFLFSFSLFPVQDVASILGRVITMGILCGTFGINVAHELGHRVNRWEQFLAKSLLLTSLYMHFFIEHNKGHHKHVATPADPSSAPYGQTLYRFWLRTVAGTYIKAWKIAADDAKKGNHAAYGWANEMLQMQVIQLAFVLSIAVFFGWQLAGYFLAAAVIGFLLLETVNYIEHYGLQRKRLADGKFERTMPAHSWNSNHPLGRLMLFELSRHSDHHYLASRKYQVLRHHTAAPQLPTGYPGSMLLATLPPVWFAVMHKRIASFGGAEVAK
jgi:alkane 1-monooxygenase